MSEWISVKDRLPELEQEVLLFDDWKTLGGERRTDMRVGYLSSFSTTKDRNGLVKSCEWSGMEYAFNITHWQPLPSPPKSE